MSWLDCQQMRTTIFDLAFSLQSLPSFLSKNAPERKRIIINLELHPGQWRLISDLVLLKKESGTSEEINIWPHRFISDTINPASFILCAVLPLFVCHASILMKSGIVWQTLETLLSKPVATGYEYSLSHLSVLLLLLCVTCNLQGITAVRTLDCYAIGYENVWITFCYIWALRRTCWAIVAVKRPKPDVHHLFFILKWALRGRYGAIDCIDKMSYSVIVTLLLSSQCICVISCHDTNHCWYFIDHLWVKVKLAVDWSTLCSGKWSYYHITGDHLRVVCVSNCPFRFIPCLHDKKTENYNPLKNWLSRCHLTQ